LFVSSTHVCTPVEHEVTPFLHAELGFVAHDWPGVHSVHWPFALQTWLTAAAVPAALTAPSTQVGAAGREGEGWRYCRLTLTSGPARGPDAGEEWRDSLHVTTCRSTRLGHNVPNAYRCTHEQPFSVPDITVRSPTYSSQG
jgi:hypothetical protein